MEMYQGDETIGRFLERFNAEFKIGIRTDEVGRLIEDEAGPSRREDEDTGEEDGSSDNDEDGNDNNGGGDEDGGDEGENLDENLNDAAIEDLSKEKDDAEKVKHIQYLCKYSITSDTYVYIDNMQPVSYDY